MFSISRIAPLCLGIVGAISALPAHAQDRPVIHDKWGSTQYFDQLVDFINKDCRPNAPRDIQVVFNQSKAGGSYIFYVFCRKGDGLLGPVKVESYTHKKDALNPDYVDTLITKKFVAVMGLYAGHSGSTAKDTLYYLVSVTAAN